jgi:PhnB protein
MYVGYKFTNYKIHNKAPMTQINAYLTFNGNCQEAMTFYQNCFGGELILQTVGESPLAEQMPAKMHNHIIHASLTNGTLVMFAADKMDKSRTVKGNTVSLIINCRSEEEIRAYYERLSTDGEATQPLEDTFWGALSGGLTDKFGIRWVLNFARRQSMKIVINQN